MLLIVLSNRNIVFDVSIPYKMLFIKKKEKMKI